jgi:MFS family permease
MKMKVHDENAPLVLRPISDHRKSEGLGSDGSFVRVYDIVNSLPKEVWFMYAVKYLESYSFFILAYSLVLYLSEEFGFGDEQASWAYGIYGILVSVYGLGMGAFIDYMGVRKSLLVGLSLLIISRAVLALTHSVSLLVVLLTVALPVGAALTLPVLQIGIKRHTENDTSTRAVAFSGFYIVMNVSAMTAAPCIDAFHRLVPLLKHTSIGAYITPYRLLIFAGALLSCASLWLTYNYIHDEEQETPHPPVSFDSFRHVFKSSAFWRFVLLAVLLLGVRSIYRHLDATFPKYMVRNFGKDAPYGSLIALNPFCVVIVTILSAPLGLSYHPVPVIILGSFISALSPLVLALGTSYTNAIIFVLLLSIGEGIWSPRLYEYSVMIAEKGREGTYMALAAAPMFLATLLTGATSGTLLERYSPETGERHPEIMWAIIGLTSILSPVLMLLLRRVIEEPENRKE